MKTATEANGLDVAAIHPSRGAKYSPNLHKWLTQLMNKHRARTSSVFRDRDGVLWIGRLDDGLYLIGRKLNQVLCGGRKAESMAYILKQLGPLEEVTDFWTRYTADGRCAIDPEHKMHFVGDDTRWRTTGDHRECLWCGNHSQKLRRWVEQIQIARSAWEPVGNNTSFAGPGEIDS
jgi:hypothetical protein